MAEIFRPPYFQVESAAGVPLSGAKLYFYVAGTTTDQAVYQEIGLSTPHTQPVVADASGIFPAIYLGASTYKAVLKTSADVEIKSYDNINATSAGSTVLDGTFRIQNTSDNTKQIAFSAASITSGQTRTLTVPDKSGTIAMTSDILSTVPFTAASASAAASLLFAEDTDNGSNKVTLQGPASTSDITVTLPAEAGTLVVGSASSTDNNIPRFDGALGKLQAGTGLAIDDTFNLTMASPGGAEGTKYPAFFCRAWVNFNGTGTVAIRGSGNVSSITDNGTGDYTVNFTTALADANYAPVVSAGDGTQNNLDAINHQPNGTEVAPTTSACRISFALLGTGARDQKYVSFLAVR